MLTVVYVDELISYEQRDEPLKEVKVIRTNAPYETRGYTVVARQSEYIQMPDNSYKPYFIYGSVRTESL